MVYRTSNGATERKKQSALFIFLKRMIQEKPLGTACAVLTIVLLLSGIFANLIAPYGMNQTTAQIMFPISAAHWLGTDNLGRDILSRIIFGSRISVIVGLGSAAISIVISIFMGILSGYFGGTFDLVFQRFVDAWMCVPALILMMVVISIIGPGIWQVTVVMGVWFGIVGSRIVRSATLSIRENMYVQASVAIGASHFRIITRHLLPNIMAPIIIMFTTVVPQAILIEASLSFLGYGIPPPNPSWGSMLAGSARNYMLQDPLLVIWPGLALTIVVYGVNMFGDALRDLLDPRLKGGIGRYDSKAKMKFRFLKKVLGETEK